MLISGRKSELSRNCRGFTLVELAIVMTIIGLLIGGVFQGRTLLRNAKVAKTVTQIEDYRGAVVSFRDRYSQFPGDMANATQRLPGCGPNRDEAGNYCLNGDGNSKIGPWEDLTGIGFTGATPPRTEVFNFWKHLAMANLIGGVDIGLDSKVHVEGGTNPQSAFIRMWLVYYDDGPFSWPKKERAGHYLFIFPIYPSFRNMSYANARKIDAKMDDGLPLTGDIIVQGAPQCIPPPGNINEWSDSPGTSNPRQCAFYAKVSN